MGDKPIIMSGASMGTVVHPESWARADMVDGYFDGRDANAPEPSANRSASYRHGFANGRDALRGEPRATVAELRRLANEAVAADEGAAPPLPMHGREEG